MLDLTPRQIVAELDKYIVGQQDAKRAIAIAIRNRWRRQHVEGEMHEEIGPMNMMMIGPTGVGKTEIARRLASLTGAPFVKVDATKYTEVGYYGNDVESMARDLVDNAFSIVRSEEREKNVDKAKEAAEKKIVDLLVDKFEHEKRDMSEFSDGAEQNAVAADPAKEPSVDVEKRAEDESPKVEQLSFDEATQKFAEDMRKATAGIKFDPEHPERGFSEMLNAFGEMFNGQKNADVPAETPENAANANDSKDDEKAKKKARKEAKRALRDQVAELLAAGKLDDELVPIDEERRSAPIVMGGIGFDHMQEDLQNMLESMSPKRSTRRELKVSEARGIFQEQEADRLLDKAQIGERAIKLAEDLGIIFIDEIDKIVGSDGSRGPDVSRQGVQRDLLPVVEGTLVKTKYGFVSTKHVLFIAAGAFHRVKPSDLTPELQGRFPIRVELSELTKDDFVRILKEPKSALTKQYAALMKTENVDLVFCDDAIEALAEYAAEANQTTQNIGARRLCTIMERLLEDLNFEAAEMGMGRVEINAAYVHSKLDKVVHDEDLSKFVL